MPHMNVLDLSVFPCMLRHHTKNAETVWNELPNSKIASGFIQASHITKEVIKQNGDNCFLGTQCRISTGIWRDFKEMAKGLSGKDKKKLGAPTA
jgi:hypothetical protein